MFKFHKCFSVLVLFTYLFTTTANAQSIITYPGNGALGNPNDLGAGTGNALGSLFPSTPSNNSVTVNDNVSKNVYGGIGGSGTPVNGNNTYINNGRVSGVIYGGWSNDSDATSNHVTISHASADGDNSTIGERPNDNVSGSPSTINTIYGAYIDGGAGSSLNNSITVNAGASVRSMYGAYNNSTGNLTGNSITINDGDVGAPINGDMIISGAYAGMTNNGALVNNNFLAINGGHVYGTNMNLYGGRGTTTSSLKNNYVSITGGDVDVEGIYGGQNVNGQGEVLNNYVNISGGTVTATGGIYGGQSTVGSGGESAVVTGNGVTVSGNAIVNGNIYGGHTNVRDAEGNYVTISGGQVTGNLYGGWSSSGKVDNNTVLVTGGSVVGNLYGGYIDNNTEPFGVDGNVVTVSGGRVDGDLYGGYIDNGTVTGNEVNVSGTVNGDIYGGHSGDDSAYVNFVTISGGAVNGNIYGGHSSSGWSQYSEVLLRSGTVTGNVYGGYSNSGKATDNTVRLSDSTVIGNVYGGYSNSDNATDNTVRLSDSTVIGNVYGGYSDSGSADNNTVELSGSTVTGTVYGSDDNASSTGNTLTATSGSSSVGGIENFESVDAYSGATIRVTGNKPNAAAFNNLTNNGWVTFVNGVTQQGVATVAGDYSGSGHLGLDVLFSNNATSNDADSIIFDNTPSETVSFYFKALPESVANPYAPMTKIAEVTDRGTLDFTTVEHGFGIYSYDIEQVGNDILVGLKADHTDQTTKPYSDSKAAGLASLSFAFDTFMRTSLQKAVSETEGNGLGISITGTAAVEQINDNHDIDLNTMSMTVALAYHRFGSPIAVGGYVEFLHSDYKTKNKVITDLGAFNTKSGGTFNNITGGIFMQYRQNFYESNGENFASWLSGAHIEVAAQYGQSEMRFSTHSVNPSYFDNNADFAGLSLGGGYVFDTPKNIAVDLYGYGMYINEYSDDVTDSIGQHIEFEEAEILHFIAGTRTAYTGISYMRPYIGLAMNYEAFGNPKIYIDGHAANQSDLSGFSGMFELGFHANHEMGLSFDYKIMASVGKRSGIGGLFETKYVF